MTPYQRIARAAQRETGVRLSPDDVKKLVMDGAIIEVAVSDDEYDALPKDEREHATCFESNNTAHLVVLRRHCKGDGWYRCKQCAHWVGNQKD
jgi:hypothetical protein